MNKHLSIFLLLAVLLSACGKSTPPIPTPLPPTSTFTPVPTLVPTASPTETSIIPATPVCVSPEPAQADIDRALAYTGKTLSDWERTYSVGNSRVAVTWQDVGHGAVVYLEALIFPCGYEEPDLNKYFSDENWKTIFSSYESYAPVTQCKTDKGLRLYQFKTKNQGLEYAINYWVQNDTNTRVIVTMMVFPKEQLGLLETYAAQLFSDLPNCS